MQDQFKTLFSVSSSRQNPSIFVFALAVILMHLGLLGIGTFWNPSPPKPKEKPKVVVQTVRLEPMRPAPTQSRIAPPAAVPVAVSSPPPQAAIPIPVEEEIAQIEIPLPKEEAPPKKEEPKPAPKVQEAPKPIPPAVKEIKKESKPEAKPSPAPPKPVVKDDKKPAPKKPAPVKKPAEQTKKPVKTEPAKIEPAKPKPNPEAEKKKQQEKAEADKKRQEEKAEAEKKRQEQLAIEKKRQQEIAAAQEVARQKEQVLISKAQENLAKMGETRGKISSAPSLSLEETSLPKELGDLQVDALPISEPGTAGDWGAKEVSYGSEIASRLKKGLRLPDYGAVKIKLTLDRTGKVIKVETTKSESQKNKTYVESKIPTLLFPPFGQRFKDAAQNTFEITFQNDS